MPPDPDLLAAELAAIGEVFGRFMDLNWNELEASDVAPFADAAAALLALARRVKALAEQWHGERGNDYSASALYARKLREVLGEELLGEGQSDA